MMEGIEVLLRELVESRKRKESETGGEGPEVKDREEGTSKKRKIGK